MYKRVSLLICCLGIMLFKADAQNVGQNPSIAVQQVDNSIKITYIDSHIKIENAPLKSRLEIYNIVGSKVKVIELTHSTGEYPVSLPKGYYIVRIDGGIVRKIVVR